MESPWGRDLQDQEWDVSFQVKAHPRGPQEAIPLPKGGVARGSGAEAQGPEIAFGSHLGESVGPSALSILGCRAL